MTSSPLPPSAAAPSPRSSWMWMRFAVLAAALPALWAVATHDLLPHAKLCMFQIVTGRPCPGCGMTRSVLALARGDLLGSLRMHPVGVLFAAAFVAALAGTAAGLVRGDDPVVDFIARRGVKLTVALVVLLLAVWVLRAFLVPAWSPDPIR